MKRFFRDFSPENNKRDFLIARRVVEVILYLIGAIQLFQEFSDSRYFNQLLIILSNTGMFTYFYGAFKKILYNFNNSEIDYYKDQTELMEFHNNFIASVFIPMIFLFNTENGIFTGTTLWDLDSMKKIILLITFVSLVYYRFLVYFTKKYTEKVKNDKEFEDSDAGINRFNLMLWLTIVGLMIDGLLCSFNIILSTSMQWKNYFFGNTILDISNLFWICLIILFFIKDKKHIILSIALSITIIFASYSAYMQFSAEKPYNFGTTDYSKMYKFSKVENHYIDISCRFETDENGKNTYKCYIFLVDGSDGGYKIVEDAIAYGTYEAFEYKNSLFTWQDRDSDVFIKKKNLDKGEKPVSFRIIDEVIECKEDGYLKNYIEKKNHVSRNFNDVDTEAIIVGDNYIDFRGNDLDKTEELYIFIDEKFVNIKI